MSGTLAAIIVPLAAAVDIVAPTKSIPLSFIILLPALVPSLAVAFNNISPANILSGSCKRLSPGLSSSSPTAKPLS